MRFSTFLGALLLVLAGTVLFLFNLGYISGISIIYLLRWWPVLLIVAGLFLLWKGKIPRLLGLGITIVLAGVTVLYFLLQQPSLPEFSINEHLQIDRKEYPDLSSAGLKVSFSGGELIFSNNTATPHWLEADFIGFAAITSKKVEKKHLQVEVSQEETARTLIKQDRRPHGDLIWAINLNPELSWALSIETGAVKSRLHLENMRLDAVNLAAGAGDIEIVFGNNSTHTPVKIEAGASNIKVRVPEDAGIQVRLRGALTHTNLPELGWLFSDKKYRSANYEEAGNRYDLDLNLAVGRFKLERY